MEDPPLDYETSRATLVAFRDLARYFVASHDQYAAEARAHLRQVSRGRDAFFASLHQDLHDICIHCEQTEEQTGWGSGFKQDVHALLQCLASIVVSSEVAESFAMTLQDFREQTSGWKYQQSLSLSADQLVWLHKHVGLQYLTAEKRKIVLRQTTAIAQSLPKYDDIYGDDADLAQKDLWALKTAIDLCDPLHNVYDVLFRNWACECPTPAEHTSVLVAFAVPCRGDDAATHCLLRFTTSREKKAPWSTVLLNIANETSSRSNAGDTDLERFACSTTASIAQVEDDIPVPRLHDCLIRCSSQERGVTKLRFSSLDNKWAIAPHDADRHARFTMVPLGSLFVEDSSHPISKRPFKERLSLALLVTYAFLQLGDSPWFPYGTESINVWFYQAVGSEPTFLQPYIEVGLTNPEDRIDTQSDQLGFLRLINSNMPCLPLLGKLILELIVGHSIEHIGSIERLLASYQHQQPIEAPYILGAVESCISDTNFREETIHGNELQRERFLERVIFRLHGLLSKCGTSLEVEIEAAQKALSLQNAKKRRRHSSAGGASSKRPYTLAFGASEAHTMASNTDSSHALHDNGSLDPCDEGQRRSANGFVESLQKFHVFIVPKNTDMRPVRVAILDTGLRFSTKALKLYGSRQIEFRTWLNHSAKSVPVKDGDDPGGHGTRCATAFLQCSSDMTELFVGQVLESRDPKAANAFGPRDDPERVAEAIRYAVKEWRVDIISMSFGYEDEIDSIHEALKYAEDNNVLLLAAASNVGCNTARARRWPGKRDNVLSICATEGNGYPYKNNPPYKRKANNFATLGVMVPTWSSPEYMTGTSIATPIAAAIAASIIELVRNTERDYLAQFPGHEKRIKAAKDAMSKASGMGKVFEHMAQEKGDYDYIHPTNLLTQFMTPVKLLEAIFDKLEE